MGDLVHLHSELFSQDLHPQWVALRSWLKTRATELGFADLKITDTDVSEAHPRVLDWIKQGRHGAMQFFERHQELRANPNALQPGALRSICLTMPYLHPQPSVTTDSAFAQSDASSLEALIEREQARLAQPDQAVVSVYARGRDYHKVVRTRLQILARELEQKIEALLAQFTSKTQAMDKPITYRVFSDSAPLMEVELARKAGLGWRGKHTLLLNRESGSFFFLGEILLNVPLPIDAPIDSHCGSCQACMDICPTQAITAPYQLDARRCISYLTIEHPSAIPIELRKAIGNRVYGCDDCQLVCPWNKYAQASKLSDFAERHGLGSRSLLELWAWNAEQFSKRHAGSPIARIGYERWRRNLAVALGNALAASTDAQTTQTIIAGLRAALPSASPMVAEHIAWALAQEADR